MKNTYGLKKVAGIDDTFNFKLHQFEQSHNYYFHGLLALSSVFVIFNYNLIHNFSSEFKEKIAYRVKYKNYNFNYKLTYIG